MTRTIVATLAIACLGGLGCVDDAETMYRVCEGSLARGEVKAAASACDEAVKRSPASKFGKLATDKRKEIQPALDKVLGQEKAVADAKAAKDAADQKARDETVAKLAAENAAATKAAQDERARALRDKISKRYWSQEPDGTCTGNGDPAYRWTYEGGTFAEDAELAKAEGCVAAYSIASNTIFCCPQKPVTLTGPAW